MLAAEEQTGPGERRGVITRWGPSSVGPPRPPSATSPPRRRRWAAGVVWPPKSYDFGQKPTFFSSNQGLKRVAWPPPPDCTDSAFLAEVPENQQAPIYNGTSHKPWENSLSNSYYQPSDNQPQFHQEPQRPARTAPTPPRPFANSPPPSTVTLRPEPPISQVPAPVFQSQPAVKRQEPIKMRGDQKWPPAHYKEAKQAEMQAAQEAAARARAAGKPKRVKKDYSSFFAQNALLPTYPGYKAPPGTQHYEELGTSNL